MIKDVKLKPHKKTTQKPYPFIETVMWYIDVYFVFLLYNERKFKRYKQYMKKKWGKRCYKSNQLKL